MIDCLYGVYGTGGYGRQVMPLARQQLLNQGGNLSQLVFIDDNVESKEINGHRVLSFEAFLQTPASDKYVAIAISNSQIREQLATRLRKYEIWPWSIRDSTVTVMDNVILGEGSILSTFCLVTSNIRIGRFFQANSYSHVAHDCIIGDFVTFAPGVRCNGNVVIEDHAYIGTGAMLRQGTPDKPLVIGKNAVVGMGAVVTRDVPPNTTVVGNPAKPLVKAD